MKRLSVVVLSLLLATLGSGCRDSGESSTEQLILASEEPSPAVQPSDDKKTVALVMKTLTNPFFKDMEKGARKAESELDVELVVKTGAKETSIEQQIAIVRSLIRDRVDAIVIAPGSSTELLPVLKKAQDAGIELINIDNRLDVELARKKGLAPVPFISVDNEAGAYLSAKELSSKLTKPTKVAILEGIRTAQNARDRKKGALRAFAESDDIEVVASETANWKLDEGYQVTARLFEQHPDIGAMFCANDMMALGAIEYLQEAGKQDVHIAAYDALEEAKRAIREGKMVATIDQQAALQGYRGVQFAVHAMNGAELAPETYVDIKLITAETLQDR